MQRLALAYLMQRERQEREDSHIEKFKLNMIAAHPEYTGDILSDFERMKNGEFELTEEDLENAQPMSAQSLEEALRQMKELGVGLEG